MTRIKTKRLCALGHTYYKSSDCNSCPVCESKKPSGEIFLAKLAAPARRALQHHGLFTLSALAKVSEAEVLRLHGIGKTTLPVLREALKDAGLHFKTNADEKTK